MSSLNIDDLLLQPTSITSSTAIQGKSPEDLGMEDFLNLLVAQMTNQDMLNPMEDTEYIAQMAQFSTLQGIQTLQEYQLSSYASSYVGKYVTIAETTASGALETITGKVEAVTFYDGDPKVQVNGNLYDLYKVMEVSDTSSAGSLADASQYIGKEVTVSTINASGITIGDTGYVTAVKMQGNIPMITVNNVDYPLSALQSVNDNSTSDPSIYIGKQVTVTTTDNGQETTVSGIVSDAKFIEGLPYITINGKNYPMDSIISSGYADDENTVSDYIYTNASDDETGTVNEALAALLSASPEVAAASIVKMAMMTENDPADYITDYINSLQDMVIQLGADTDDNASALYDFYDDGTYYAYKAPSTLI